MNKSKNKKETAQEVLNPSASVETTNAVVKKSTKKHYTKKKSVKACDGEIPEHIAKSTVILPIEFIEHKKEKKSILRFIQSLFKW